MREGERTVIRRYRTKSPRVLYSAGIPPALTRCAQRARELQIYTRRTAKRTEDNGCIRYNNPLGHIGLTFIGSERVCASEPSKFMSLYIDHYLQCPARVYIANVFRKQGFLDLNHYAVGYPPAASSRRNRS